MLDCRFDLTEEASSGITDGTILAMIQQQPKEMGRLAVEAVVKAIKGEKVERIYQYQLYFMIRKI